MEKNSNIDNGFRYGKRYSLNTLYYMFDLSSKEMQVYNSLYFLVNVYNTRYNKGRNVNYYRIYRALQRKETIILNSHIVVGNVNEFMIKKRSKGKRNNNSLMNLIYYTHPPNHKQ